MTPARLLLPAPSVAPRTRIPLACLCCRGSAGLRVAPIWTMHSDFVFAARGSEAIALCAWLRVAPFLQPAWPTALPLPARPSVVSSRWSPGALRAPRARLREWAGYHGMPRGVTVMRTWTRGQNFPKIYVFPILFFEKFPEKWENSLLYGKVSIKIGIISIFFPENSPTLRFLAWTARSSYCGHGQECSQTPRG